MKTELYRNKKEKVIAGVCSGLSDYFDIDVVILRVIFLATALVWGISILIYIFFWIAMPVKQEDGSETTISENEEQNIDESLVARKKQVRSKRVREILAIILIVTGIFATMDNLFFWLSGRMWIPMVLITLGLLVLFYTTREENLLKKEIKNE
ncbi:MAG: PspC domain-containing protein [Ignavibacteria bacterium]|nr:PspC domain-containing protein [Ignavibacteria bacterium]